VVVVTHNSIKEEKHKVERERREENEGTVGDVELVKRRPVDEDR